MLFNRYFFDAIDRVYIEYISRKYRINELAEYSVLSLKNFTVYRVITE